MASRMRGRSRKMRIHLEPTYSIDELWVHVGWIERMIDER